MTQSKNPQYILFDDAADELKVRRSTLYYYLRALGLKTHRFPLDKHAYLLIEDFKHIKQLKEEKEERMGETPEEALA